MFSEDFPPIKFDYQLCDEIAVEILANGDGTGVLVIDKKEGHEWDWGLLTYNDKSSIKCMVRQWVDHHRYMNEHPAMDGFGSSYVSWINSHSK